MEAQQEKPKITTDAIYHMAQRVYKKLNQVSNGKRFIKINDAMQEIGPGNIRYGLEKGYLHKIKGPARNSSTYIERSEYEAYIDLIKEGVFTEKQ